MSQARQIDVYREWLGVTEKNRPLNYYQLLRIRTFEDDTHKIREHYRRMNAHVRKYATGEYSRLSQELLNELAKAMLCLTDLQRKREYDASLGRKDFGEGKRRTFEEILLGEKIIDRDQLDRARNFADATGLELRDALVQQKMASQEAVTQAYAEAIGLPFVQVEDIGIDAAMAARIPATTARQHACLPLMVDGDVLLMASPHPLDPTVEEDIRLRVGKIVRPVLCTQAGITPLIAQFYPRDTAGAPAAAGRPEQAASQPALTPEERFRQRRLYTIIGFNAAVILTMFLFILFRGAVHLVKMTDFILAITLASGVAAATYYFSGKR